MLEDAPGVSISSSGFFIGFVFTLSLPFDFGTAFAAVFGAALERRGLLLATGRLMVALETVELSVAAMVEQLALSSAY